MNIILFRGRPGVGKTVLSNALAQRLSFPILRKDDIYDVAAEVVEAHSDRNKVSYNTLYKILETNLPNSSTIILDYAFQHSQDLLTLRQWCNDNGAVLRSILVTCTNEALWADRFNKRADNPTPNQLITNFDELEQHYGTMQLSPETDELLVDTVNPVEVIMPQIVAFV